MQHESRGKIVQEEEGKSKKGTKGVKKREGVNKNKAYIMPYMNENAIVKPVALLGRGFHLFKTGILCSQDWSQTH